MSTPPEAQSGARRFVPPRALLAAGAVVLLVAIILIAVAPRIPPLLHRGAPAQASAVNCVAPKATLPHSAADFKPGFIYQVMLDRFFDGDKTNDNPASTPGLSDSSHQNWKLYWGGDLKGLSDKVPYIAGMGATAIWISPPVENVNTPLDYGDGNGPQAGYHGYWTIDDYRIDPHLGTWEDFDHFVTTAHQHGLQVMVDFPANDSNPRGLGQFGALYKDGALQASYNNDPNGWFHHNQTITNFNDMYDLEYGTLADLADLAQENPAVDAYLKGAIAQFIAHGVDGIRFDAAKHIPGATGGWLRTEADSIESTGPRYLVGEWQVTDPTDLTYPDAVRFANNSGISLLNFSIMSALDDAYAKGAIAGPAEVDSVLQREAHDLTWPNDQANFVDNHDFPRFLSLDNNRNDLQAALAVVMTIPGVPIVYYGTEQYLHDDTLGGGDPYNRPMMSSFGTATPAYQLLRCLSALRQSNPALAYGDYHALHLSHSLYVYQRQFGQNVVVVAVNDSPDPATVKAGPTALPAGTYQDDLDGAFHGAFHGAPLTVGAGGVTKQLSLPGYGISVWQFTAPATNSPRIGSVGPELARAGETLVVDGQGFAPGDTLSIGQYQATISAISAHSITARLPASMPGGAYQARVCDGGACSAGYAVNVASGPQIPVNITVNGLPHLTPTQRIYITGALPELGSGSTAPSMAAGPMLSAQAQDSSRFLLVSLPACQSITMSFEAVDLSGAISAEGATHHVQVPCSGEGSATLTWGQ